ncbi:MAG: ATP phosphoribosyltransferase regulatory subunit [Clostridia bacterium]|nr:ATP phosphoribosyltransferase regulatory subunit [Clostridia bacterium]
MIINDSVLKAEEKIIFSLRSLYEKFGYKPFKIKKFEEYDLYAKNKDFLVSGNVITFTDIDGKLMALKPDVTLSIVKNSVDDKPCKLYYNENVYRVTKGATSYKEIMQAGVEIIGDIDAYLVYEMLSLSALSLATVSNEYLLNISDLGIVSGITGASNLTENGKKRVLDGITCKNEKQVKDVLNEENITGKYYDAILALVNIYGNYSEVFSKREVLCVNEEVSSRVDFLLSTVKLLDDNGFNGKTRIDFSIILDTNYYNGIVFNGVVPGANGYVLSGGQYDNLMKKMGKKQGAIGFAVYLDVLQKLSNEVKKNAQDLVILYNENTSLIKIANAVKKAQENNQTVLVTKIAPSDLSGVNLLDLTEGK